MSLEIISLNFSYPKKEILQDLSLTGISPGELAVLIGPNAAGKSTLFRCLAGLQQPDKGKMMLGDVDLMTMTSEERFKQICYLPQVFVSNAMLTVFDVVLLAKKHNSLSSWKVDQDDLDHIDALLKQLNIEHISQRYVRELSGGQQQMVSICQALVRSPELFLFDEPTSALDLGRQHRIMELFKNETQKRNTITIVVLHDLALAARYADKVLLMDEGQIKLTGTAKEVFSSDIISDIYRIDIQLLTDKNGSLVVSASC